MAQAQLEVDRAAHAVTMETEEDEEFGPQPIKKLEVSANGNSLASAFTRRI